LSPHLHRQRHGNGTGDCLGDAAGEVRVLEHPEKVTNAVEAGRAAARQTRGELEHRIAERKAAYKDS